MNEKDNFKKYLKYKLKYLNLKKKLSGGSLGLLANVASLEKENDTNDKVIIREILVLLEQYKYNKI